uniref:Uncharacterized protein n=1 Tax=Romanomermis culicivorax TaxID=13658 RepID=A0A915ICN5_ROMCU
MKWEEETRKKNGKGHGNDEIGFYDIWEHYLQQLGNDLYDKMMVFADANYAIHTSNEDC